MIRDLVTRCPAHTLACSLPVTVSSAALARDDPPYQSAWPADLWRALDCMPGSALQACWPRFLLSRSHGPRPAGLPFPRIRRLMPPRRRASSQSHASVCRIARDLAVSAKWVRVAIGHCTRARFAETGVDLCPDDSRTRLQW